jgi:outer membrane protein assembly factor BamB
MIAVADCAIAYRANSVTGSISLSKICRWKFTSPLMVWALSTLLLTSSLGHCGLQSEGFAQDNWTRFRGENGSGISQEKGWRATWKPDEFAWKITLPGNGHSSPVTWDDGVFVTCSTESGSERYVIRYNAVDGSETWRYTVSMGSTALHKKNSYSSMSPTTDGKHVYATFADDAQQILLAIDMQGKEVWRVKFGPFDSQHGPGTGPIVHQDLVILARDIRGPSEIIALNRDTGDIIWKTERQFKVASYATPLIYSQDNQPDQIIVLRDVTGITGLNSATGNVIWNTGDLGFRTVASPVLAQNKIVCLCGQGGSGTRMLVVEPGNLLHKDFKLVYEKTKDLPYVVTPLIVGNHMFLWADKGVVYCLDFTTGEQIWKHRITGNFSGSPVYVDGKMYCINEAGDLVVMAATDKAEPLGSTPLEEYSQATPAVANGRMFLRTQSHLICVTK